MPNDGEGRSEGASEEEDEVGGELEPVVDGEGEVAAGRVNAAASAPGGRGGEGPDGLPTSNGQLANHHFL